MNVCMSPLSREGGSPGENWLANTHTHIERENIYQGTKVHFNAHRLLGIKVRPQPQNRLAVVMAARRRLG